MTQESRFIGFGAILGAAVVGLVWISNASVAPAAAQTPTSTSTASNSQIDQQMAELRRIVQGIDAAAQKAQVIAVINQLSAVGLHALDETLDAGQAIPATALGNVRRARTSIQAISWPSSSRSMANRLADEMTKLETALRDENADRGKEPAHNSHELSEDLSDAIFSWLGGR